VDFFSEHIVTVYGFSSGNIWTAVCELNARWRLVLLINCQPLLLVRWTSTASSLEEDKLWWCGLFIASGVVGIDCCDVGLGVWTAESGWSYWWSDAEWGDTRAGAVVGVLPWGWVQTAGCNWIGEGWGTVGMGTGVCCLRNRSSVFWFVPRSHLEHSNWNNSDLVTPGSHSVGHALWWRVAQAT
jgi:hypothetical protein